MIARGSRGLAWFQRILDGCIEDLRQDMERRGKQRVFQVFKAAILDFRYVADDPPPLDEVAKQFGIRETEVHDCFQQCRHMMQTLVHERILDLERGA